MKVVYLVFAILSTIAFAQEEKPTEPTKCSAANQGRCPCGNEDEGFTTYTFWQGDQQRCFHVFFPPERKGEVLPVAFLSHCYSKDRLSGTQSDKASKPANKAAARYGYAKIGISTPNTNWEFGNDGIVNDDKPRPCADEDSRDIAYVRKIIQWAEANPELDASRMFAWGFSQNSMFSAYIGHCFPENFVGVYQAGSGLALSSQPLQLPGCQGLVSASVFRQCRAEGDKCKTCKAKYPCTECEYWPIYPCYNPEKPMIHCIEEYTNDGISTDKKSQTSSARNMYEALMREGHDGRLIRFDPDGKIKGSHKEIGNADYWKVSCLDITEQCSEECEANFFECYDNENPTEASAKVKAFATCMDPKKFKNLDGCTMDCAPTINMLYASQTPVEAEADNFGKGPSGRPENSKCSV